MSELKNFIQNATSLASNGDIISSSVPYPKVGIETLTNKRHPLNNKPIYTIAYSGTSTGTDIVIPTHQWHLLFLVQNNRIVVLC